MTTESRPLLAPTPAAPPEPLPAEPSFAIVITAYQAADTVAAAVRSALRQERPAEEVIVVDDGSTDELELALRPFADRIELIRQENGGGASARNRGLEATKSDFMAVLDADDEYQPRRLAAIAAAARLRPDLDIVTTDARFVVDGEPGGAFSDGTPFASEDQRLAIFSTCFPGGWPAVRRESLEAVGGFDESLRIAYDWDCWLRLILAGSAAGMVDEPLYDYVLRSGSLAAHRVASLWERVRLLEKATINPNLRPSELPSLERAIAWRRSEARREELYTLAQKPDARARLLRLATGGGAPARVRAGAVLGAGSPHLLRRLLRRDQARG
jgi:hypothetical protein